MWKIKKCSELSDVPRYGKSGQEQNDRFRSSWWSTNFDVLNKFGLTMLKFIMLQHNKFDVDLRKLCEKVRNAASWVTCKKCEKSCQEHFYRFRSSGWRTFRALFPVLKNSVTFPKHHMLSNCQVEIPTKYWEYFWFSQNRLKIAWERCFLQGFQFLGRRRA